MIGSWRKLARGIDPCLAAVLIAATLFCLRGISWGRVEDWNRDQMALRTLHGLRPTFFQKPPLDTYLNHLLVLAPLHAAEKISQSITGTKQEWKQARLVGSRLLVVAFVLGTIALGYVVSLRFFGLVAARASALFLGTSAGFIASAHFLSCDTPLLFFLCATLYFAQRIVQRGETRDYICAGMLTGLATAMKYNGLAAGILIPVAHLLSARCVSWRRCLLHPRLFLGLAMVPAGFLIGNPYAVIEWKRFRGDFMYNYEVTPAYAGQRGHGYGLFLQQFAEILGWPGTVVLGLLLFASLVVVAHPRLRRPESVRGFLLIGSFILLYYLKIGGFARIPARFVLPVVPFALLLTGTFLARVQAHPRLVYGLLAPVIVYNAYCAALVGHRFAKDPRLAAQRWILAHVSRGQVIESSPTSPHWAELPELDMAERKATDPKWKSAVHHGRPIDLRMPSANGRSELYGRIFKGNRWVEAGRHAEGESDEQVFSLAALRQRNPNYVTIYEPDTRMQSARSRDYYAQLCANRFPYVVRFAEDLPAVSPLVYPQKIDFLYGRLTILERLPGALEK